MTPGQIIALVRDVVILIALAALIFLLVNYGKDITKVRDFEAVQKQLAQNATTEAQWRQEAQDAQNQLTADMADLRARISIQRAPIVLRGSASSCPVPSAATGTPGDHPGTRPDDAGPRGDIDVRAAINAFELYYEGKFAECRSALRQWPR
jgi:hypothetical protein